MIEEIAVVGVIGTVIAVMDQQNLIPQLSNNPRKLWFFDPARYQPVVATPIRSALRPALTTEQQHALEVKQRQAQEWALAQKQSKYRLSSF